MMIHVLLDEQLHELVPTDMTGQGTGTAAFGQIGGIFGDQIARKLGHGILTAGLHGTDQISQNIHGGGIDLKRLLRGDRLSR